MSSTPSGAASSASASWLHLRVCLACPGDAAIDHRRVHPLTQDQEVVALRSVREGRFLDAHADGGAIADTPLPTALVRREVGRLLHRHDHGGQALAYVYFEEGAVVAARGGSPMTRPDASP
jgi:YD repeat-containing protein